MRELNGTMLRIMKAVPKNYFIKLIILHDVYYPVNFKNHFFWGKCAQINKCGLTRVTSKPCVFIEIHLFRERTVIY